MANYDMPSESQMDDIEATIPKIIPDMPEGHFRGMIEQVEQVFDQDGRKRTDIVRLIIRIAECGNEEYVKDLMYYSVYLKDKQGRFIPKSYRFLCALDPELKKGGAWLPTSLIMVEFEAKIEYSGKYWNMVDPVLIQKHEHFEL
jgi:hypothetical protein